MPHFHPFRCLGLAVAALSLAGCFAGNYRDAPEPEAAKLRFITDMPSTTLGIEDAQRCEAQSTGLLNNLFAANPRRRVDMTFPAQPDIPTYIEVRMPAGRDTTMLMNSLGSGAVPCTVGIAFTPQSGAEYELTFERSKRGCQARVERLRHFEGQDLRVPLLIAPRIYPACQAAAPKPVLTAQRQALQDQIVEQSLVEEMQPPQPSLGITQTLADFRVKARQVQLKLALPQAYWERYRQNLITQIEQDNAAKGQALVAYKERYQARLSVLSDKDLRTLLPGSPTLDQSQAMATNLAMLEYFRVLEQAFERQAAIDEQSRMAQLDRDYKVCERSRECWID